MSKPRPIPDSEAPDGTTAMRVVQYGLVLLCAAITLLPYIWMISIVAEKISLVGLNDDDTIQT